MKYLKLFESYNNSKINDAVDIIYTQLGYDPDEIDIFDGGVFMYYENTIELSRNTLGRLRRLGVKYEADGNYYLIYDKIAGKLLSYKKKMKNLFDDKTRKVLSEIDSKFNISNGANFKFKNGTSLAIGVNPYEYGEIWDSRTGDMIHFQNVVELDYYIIKNKLV